MLRRLYSKIPLSGLVLAFLLIGGAISAAESAAEVSGDVAKARDAYERALVRIEKDREAYTEKRDEQLSAVFAARENLENRVYQHELSVIARRSVAGEEKADSENREVRLSRAMHAMERNAMYDTDRKALLNLQDAVEARVKAERELEEKRDEMLRNADKPGIAEEVKALIDKGIADLDKEKALAEDRFRIKYGHIDATLALEQYLARELAALESRRDALELAHGGEGKKARIGDAAYNEAVSAIEAERELLIGAVQSRLEYLEEIHRIDAKIVDDPDKAVTNWLVRGEIEGVETRREASNVHLREQAVTMLSLLPGFYRSGMADASEAGSAREAIGARLDAAGLALEMRYARDRKTQERRLAAVDNLLADGTVSGQARWLLENERKGLAKIRASLESDYRDTIKLLSSYRGQLEREFSGAGSKSGSKSDVPEEIALLERQFFEKLVDWRIRDIVAQENAHPLAALLSPHPVKAVDPYKYIDANDAGSMRDGDSGVIYVIAGFRLP